MILNHFSRQSATTTYLIFKPPRVYLPSRKMILNHFSRQSATTTYLIFKTPPRIPPLSKNDTQSFFSAECYTTYLIFKSLAIFVADVFTFFHTPSIKIMLNCFYGVLASTTIENFNNEILPQITTI